MDRRVHIGLSAAYKEYLSRPSVMSRSDVDKVLFAYIVVASHVVSLVLIQINNGV